jgi:hypothetical protein
MATHYVPNLRTAAATCDSINIAAAARAALLTVDTVRFETDIERECEREQQPIPNNTKRKPSPPRVAKRLLDRLCTAAKALFDYQPSPLSRL